MVSMIMPASSFLAKPFVVSPRRGMTVVASVSKVEAVKADKEEKKKKNNDGRRDLVFGTAAAVAYSIARAALADDEEPKRGTAAAKKKYASVCVTNPTARICRY